MATQSTPYTFRRRTIGRAASPPTWACYEQIHDDDDFSDSGSEESCSDDEADYARAQAGGHESDSGEDSDDVVTTTNQQVDDVAHDMEMDVDAEGLAAGVGVNAGEEAAATGAPPEAQKDVKGKQRAIEPEAAKRRVRKKQRSQVYTLRPILTIQRSQGFVWNQDLFVPPYIKDRYVASTSPPNSTGFISTSVSSTNSALTDYEVEVVEIRVQEGEFDGIIP